MLRTGGLFIALLLMRNQRQELRIMTDKKGCRGTNTNHHMWNNNGTWWMHYTEYPTPMTKERVRRSLKTKSVEQARLLRDEILRRLEAGIHGTGKTIMQFSCLQEAA
jgi:hypothetical protein